MTKWIRLKETLSGGRADGRPWPVAGDAIDVPDWEYDHCIAAGWAVHADPPEPEPAPEPEPEPVQAEVLEINEAGHPTGNLVQAVPARAEAVADEPGQPADEPGQPADEPGQPAEEAVPEPPRPSDPKQAWIDYAVTQGMDEDKAAAMSKADLMSRFGGRL